MNPLVGLYRFPRGMDMTEYREHFEVFNPDRNLMEQNWHSSTEDFEQNPYWVIHRVLSKDQRNRVMASLALQLKFTDWLRLEAGGMWITYRINSGKNSMLLQRRLWQE